MSRDIERIEIVERILSELRSYESNERRARDAERIVDALDSDDYKHRRSTIDDLEASFEAFDRESRLEVTMRELAEVAVRVMRTRCDDRLWLWLNQLLDAACLVPKQLAPGLAEVREKIGDALAADDQLRERLRTGAREEGRAL